MRSSVIWLGLFSLVSAERLEASAPEPTATEPPTVLQELDIRAIVPTKSGQIGINPWEVVQTDGAFNPVITDYVKDGKWVGSNTDYITQIETVTDKGKTTTKTVSAPLAAMSGPGDKMNLVMSPNLRDKLTALAEKVPQCKMKRDSSCGIDRFIEELARNPEWKNIDGLLENVKLASAQMIGGAKNLAEFLEVGGLGDLAASVGAGMGTVWAMILFYQQMSNGQMPLALKYGGAPKNNFATTSPPPKEPKPKEPVNEPPPAEAETCPKDAPTGDEAPICQGCGGTVKDKTCSKGKWKHCDCIWASEGISVQRPDGWDTDLSKAWKAAVGSSGQLLDDQRPKANCSNNYGDAVSMDKGFLVKLADEFCKRKKPEAVLTGADIHLQQYSNSQVAFKYEAGKGCQATCEQGFQSIFDACQGVNSHSVQMKGTGKVDECKSSYEYDITLGTQPHCNMDRISKIPANAFQKAPVWKKFCDHEDNNQNERQMLVNIYGDEPTRLKRDLQGRTPPANLDAYNDAQIVLKFVPNNQGVLTRKCADAFHDITQGQCGRGGSQQNLMAKEASVFVGIGTYSYTIKNAWYTVPLLGSKKHFWDPKQFNNPKAINTNDALIWDNNLRGACGATELDSFFASPQKNWRNQGVWNVWGTRYSYTVFWKKNCQLEHGPQKQMVNDPRGDGTVKCQDAYTAAAKIGMMQDKNGKWVPNPEQSVGGYQDYGCLRYMVMPVSNGGHFLKPEDYAQAAGED